MARETEHADEDSGMKRSRRQFVAGAGGIAAVGLASLAGCSGFLGGGGPKATVRNYVKAANNANAEKANGFIHPEGQASELTQQQLSMFEEATVSVDSIEVLEQTEQRADVEVTVKISLGGMEETTTGQWELRTYEGEWRIYSQSMQ